MTNSDLPSDIGGNHPLAPWLNRLKRAVMRRTPLPSVGIDLKESTNGFWYSSTAKGGGPAVTFPFQAYRSDPDYLRFMLTPGWIVTTGAPFQPGNMLDYVAAGENTTNYIYLSLTTSAATIEITTTLPGWSTSKILVAKVVCTTTAAAPVITQILRENPQVPCV